MINKKRLITLTQQLVRINSQNPPGDEYRIAHFIKDYLTRLGLKPRIYEFKNRRSNLVVELEGRNKKHSLLLTPHLDTVPAGYNWQFGPFSATIDKGKLYGLGATDCKGNLACTLEVINSLIEDKVILDYVLILAATADEESGSGLGLIPLLDKGILNPDAALVLDSDDFDIVVTQKGLIHLKVKLQGRKAHGAYPWRGINAIDAAIEILKKLKSHKWAFIKNKYLKAPTLNIGTIKGGDKVNIVADWCEFELDFRFLPGMSEGKVLRKIKEIVMKHSKKFSRKSGMPQKAAKIEIEGIQKSYSIDRHHPLVSFLTQAMKNINVNPVIKGSEGATTITFFQEKNIPAVAWGFGSEGCAHTANEYVKIDNLYKGAKVLEEFLNNYKFT
jgi:succinyl-diaminopimelate desuccinylase